VDTLKKYVCKDTILIDVTRNKHDKDLISFYLKTPDKRVAKQIEALCKEVMTKKHSKSHCVKLMLIEIIFVVSLILFCP
jgi:hypothetical protein